MIKKIAYVLLLLVVSCQSIEESPKPDRLIEKDQMVEILTDIAFVKATKGAYKKRLEENDVNLEEYIFKKHGVDSLSFAQNNKWYSNKLDEYAEIFTQVKANLQKEKTKYERLKKEEDSIKKIEDSIKKSKGEKVDKIRKLETELRFENDEDRAKQKRIMKVPSKNN